MSKKKDKKAETPLYALIQAVCKVKESRLFYNQVVMYQLLIPFISDQLVSFSTQYIPPSVDDLITDIRRYIALMYEAPGRQMSPADEATFSTMHKYIYDNLANRDTRLSMQADYGNKELLSVTELRGTGNLESNISSIINNRRTLPKKWSKLLRLNSNNYVSLLYRCFWLLQYYFVYYDRSVCTTSHFERPLSFAESQFVEYFPLNDKISADVFCSLKNHCHSYTAFFQNASSQGKIDLLSLARIIIDIIVEQINLHHKIHIDKVLDAAIFVERDDYTVTESAQYKEYQTYLGGFGTNSYDRYNMLLKYAATNCYAAQELADAYYWGKTYKISKNNLYEIDQNYEKAAEWYLKAIEKSNPPLKGACWSLSYALTNTRYDSKEEEKEAERKAIEYLKLAGDFPAAYNHIAFFIFRDAEELYANHSDKTEIYEDVLVQFLTAIRLADKAAAMDWFYGNNQIASFLMKHMDDEPLLADLNARLELNTPLELEAQLKRAASFNNPWALKHLALFHNRNGNDAEARKLFEKAMESNYNAAYYEYAKCYEKPGSLKWREYMLTASNLSFPKATYELAAVEKNRSEQRRLLTLCKQQILSEKDIDSTLLEKVNALS